MDRAAIKRKIKKMLGVPLTRFRILEDDEVEFAIVEVAVLLGDASKAKEALYSGDNFGYIDFDGRRVSVRLTVDATPLVEADVGDFVLIHSAYADSEEDLPVGIVKSVYDGPEGRCYGCSYIIPRTKIDQYSIQNMLFEITEEDYGGYPVGFYKVLTKKEALDAIQRQVTKEAENHIACIEGSLKTLKRDLKNATRILVSERYTAKIGRMKNEIRKKV